MKKKLQNIFLHAFMALLLLAPMAVTAQSSRVNSGLNEIRGPFSSFTGIGRAQTIPDLIEQIIYMLLTVGGAIAVIFIIIGGYQYMTSGGNDEQAEKGRKTLVNAVIGIVLIILSYVIVTVVVNTVSRTP